MAERAPDLQRFLDLTQRAIAARTRPGDQAATAAAKIFTALMHARGDGEAATALRLPACAHLGTAIDAAQTGPSDLAPIANAFATIEPRLAWRNRAGISPDLVTRQANAMIVGPHGLEPRDDVWVGVSLLAPAVLYPDHRHLPEEIYLVLSKGYWRQESDAWLQPGIGGIVYNPPDIVHAMRSGEAPLFAIWCLWAPANADPAPS